MVEAKQKNSPGLISILITENKSGCSVAQPSANTTLLTDGAIAGIVIAAGVVVAGVIVTIVLVRKKKVRETRLRTMSQRAVSMSVVKNVVHVN